MKMVPLPAHEVDWDVSWERDKALEMYARGAIVNTGLPLFGESLTLAINAVVSNVHADHPHTFERATLRVDEYVAAWVAESGPALLQMQHVMDAASVPLVRTDGRAGMGHHLKITAEEFRDATRVLRAVKERSG